MLLAIINENGKQTSYLYDRVADFIKDTFCPETEIITTLEFSLGKKNMLSAKKYNSEYQRKQSFLRSIAKEWSYISGETYGLSMLEYCKIEDWFYENGKRYGLLKEFKENCIC